MNEESFINWGDVVTVLLGIVIIAFAVLILHRQRKAKRKRHKRKFDLIKSNEKNHLVNKDNVNNLN